MLNPPQVDGSSGTSLLTVIVMLIIIGGPALVVLSLLHKRFSDTSKSVRSFFYGESQDTPIVTPDKTGSGRAAGTGPTNGPTTGQTGAPASDDQDQAPTGGSDYRREIEDFDLNIFKNDD